ncbi:16S rRNA (guanine(966)-N(2))-methyltransferase RsmD [Aestuariimicrobium ganziense]|uniref:16S rRNA (guanine(966)-N(2))-methyltransferase RsmD n=1 Tax=Aestuariimicrobium ganziense TaxID=2773677 RepID=UPI0019433CCF|nr:16S rRNA (guanine(966)-N(2))-methyltransferase RsmD [Aestuariimicrobium ganziense]
MSRIVAGRAGGRRLQMPAGEATRPTSDRVREAFFTALASWNGSADAAVEQHLAGIAFLDLYAGSGAVGLEAASRGASPVWLVEHDERAARVARANVGATRLGATVVQRRVQSLLATEPDQVFDVVWLDPPYPVGTDEVEKVVEQVFAGGWVASDGVVVIERSTRAVPPRFDHHEQWHRKYGETTVYWVAARAEELE